MDARDVIQAYSGGLEEREVRAQIESICASRTFRRSEQTQKFLQYICDLALRGEASRINEYLIGLEVFNRGSGYSTAEDAIVRRQAHTLRRKLDSYYANEGRSDRIRIDLPVGHYEPVFRIQTADEQSDSSPHALPQPSRRRPAVLAVAALVSAVALVAVGWILGRSSVRNVSAAGPSGAVQEIWGPWLANPAGATICFANSKVALVHLIRDETAKDSHPLHFRPAPDAERALRTFFRLPDEGYLFYRPSETKTAIAEAISAVHVADLFGRWRMPVHAMQSRLLNWDDLRRGNFVILGHNEANSWVDKLLHKYPLRLGQSHGIQRYIENAAPGPGEKSRYAKEAPESPADPTIEYALVSMLPGMTAGQHVLLISGLDGQATQMASEFLTQETKLEELLRRLRGLAPSHTGAWQFQFVLRAEVQERLATRADIVAMKVLNNTTE